MPWPTLPGNTRRTVSPALLAQISTDVLISFFYADDSWPEILGVLFNLSMASDAGKRETAYRVFATTPGIIEKQHEGAVLEAFNRGFKDEAVGVRACPARPQHKPNKHFD